ncbi:unnamed protein product [Coregonus sp. 'balchen']|nr:unnamed protein product [Coregonus sp. 'balchen']
MVGRGKKAVTKNTSTSRSARSVGQIRRLLRRTRAAIYLAAILVYSWRIAPRHIQLAVRNNDELNTGRHPKSDVGVLPNIHAVLLPKTDNASRDDCTAKDIQCQ